MSQEKKTILRLHANLPINNLKPLCSQICSLYFKMKMYVLGQVLTSFYQLGLLSLTFRPVILCKSLPPPFPCTLGLRVDIWAWCQCSQLPSFWEEVPHKEFWSMGFLCLEQNPLLCCHVPPSALSRNGCTCVLVNALVEVPGMLHWFALV